MVTDRDREDAEAFAALVRAGLWALFAAASINRSTAGQRDAHAVTDAAAAEADLALAAFTARFPIEELLA